MGQSVDRYSPVQMQEETDTETEAEMNGFTIAMRAHDSDHEDDERVRMISDDSNASNTTKLTARPAQHARALIVMVTVALTLMAVWVVENRQRVIDTARASLASLLPPEPLTLPLTLASLTHASLDDAASGGADRVSGMSDEWLQRLSPIQARPSEGFASVTANTMMLTGHAHLPPLFTGLPCVAALTDTESKAIETDTYDTRQFPRHACIEAALTLPAGDKLVAVITTHTVGTQPHSQPQHHTITFASSQLNQLHDQSLHQSMLAAFVQQCSQNDTRSSQCPPTTAPESLFALVSPVTHRYWVHGLQAHQSYVVSIQHSNGSHITAPIYSDAIAVQQQLEMFRAEQQRTTQYFNAITPTDATTATVTAGDASASDSTSPSHHRHLAPFEAASLNGGRCNTSFHQWIDEYRSWHAQQILRLRAAQQAGPTALRALLTTDPNRVRIIISNINPNSGVSDRTVGLMSLYLVSLLTRRVLLMGDDWADFYHLMQPSLQLSCRAVLPGLCVIPKEGEKDPFALEDLRQSYPVDDNGLPSDNLDTTHPKPLTTIISNRGLSVRYLTQSTTYSAQLQALGLTPETIAGCLHHSLMMLRLTALTSRPQYAAPLTVLLHRDTVGVGIQIRTGDGALAYDGRAAAASSVQSLIANGAFFHCAQDVSDTIRAETPPNRSQTVQPVWFLIADDEALRTAAVHRWGARSNTEARLVSVLIPSLLGHSSYGDPALSLTFLQHAAVEQYLYSLCTRHIISDKSGFGRLPAALGMRGQPVFSFQGGTALASCMNDESNSHTIKQMAGEWSGL